MKLFWVLWSDLFSFSVCFTHKTKHSWHHSIGGSPPLLLCEQFPGEKGCEILQGWGRHITRWFLPFSFLEPIWMKTQRWEEEEELPKTGNERKKVSRWEVQTPKVSWDENEKKLKICHFHCFHFLLYFKSWSFYGGGTHTFHIMA